MANLVLNKQCYRLCCCCWHDPGHCWLADRSTWGLLCRRMLAAILQAFWSAASISWQHDLARS